MAKYRMGFVSNSSSSSFVCDLTGHVESGYDMPLSDSGMFECVNGHTVLEDLKLNPDFVLEEAITAFVDYYNKEWRKNHITDEEVAAKCAEDKVDSWDSFFEVVQEWDDEYGGHYSACYPKEFCPICMMQDLPVKEIHAYMMKKMKLAHDDIVKEIREKFNGDYNKFKENVV